MLTVVLVTILVACGIFTWYQRDNKEEPPAFHGAFPLLGHAHLLVGDCKQLWIFLKEIAYESLEAGGVFSASIGPKKVYFVSDPDDFMKISDTCLEKVHYYRFAKPWLGDGLVSSSLPLWKLHRSRLDSVVSQTFLDGFLDVFNSQARRLVEELATEAVKGPFDHLVYTRKNALETTCCVGSLEPDSRVLSCHNSTLWYECVMLVITAEAPLRPEPLVTVLGEVPSDKGVLNSTYGEAIDQMFNILVQRFQRPWFHCDFMYSWSGLKRKQDRCLRILHNASNNILKKRKADYLNNDRESKKIEEKTNYGPKFKSFLDLFIELAVEDDGLNDQGIREHVDTMMFGAHDTVANVLMCTMLLIGSHPEVQEKIFDELQGIFGDDDRDVTKQDLSQLVYLEAVIKESMRIYPVVPLITRHLDRDIKLRNYTLKKGKTCVLFIFGVCRHPMWGSEVEKFKPERWMDPASMPEYSNTLVGFGMGKRSCVGKPYAFMLIKTTLVHVFRRYRVSGNHSVMVTKIDVMLRTLSGHHVSIEMRKK